MWQNELGLGVGRLKPPAVDVERLKHALNGDLTWLERKEDHVQKVEA